MRHPAIERLEEQLAFYDASARRKRRGYRVIKTAEVIIASAVPSAAALGASGGLLAVLGSLVVVCVGIQQVFQPHTRFLAHRSTYEMLKREQALFRAGAGEYRGLDEPEKRLAERVEDIRAAETTEWVEQEQAYLRAAQSAVGTEPR